MAAIEHDRALAQRLDAARKEAAQPLTSDQVAAIIREVVGSLDGDISAVDLKIYTELEGLAGYIQTARSEIAALRPAEIKADHIPTATDELDAVIGATEEATGRILDAAEQIQNIAAGLDPEVRDQLTALSTEIFEASNFQDITGQRIGKVVRTLKHIEGKIDSLVGILGDEVNRAQVDVEPVDRDPDQDLLNGPQLPQNANGQDEIDRLLAGFD